MYSFVFRIKIDGILLVLFLLAACTTKEQSASDKATTEKSDSNLAIKKAKHFTVEYYDNYKIAKVIEPWLGANQTIVYLLLPQGTPRPENVKADEVIEIPLNNIVCFSTSHIPLLEYIGESEKLIGFPNTRYINTPTVRERIEQGKVKDLGSEMDVNIELLLALRPDMVMAYGMGKNTGKFNIIAKAGIPVVYNADYLETDPLGRAEWIKFMSLFFNKERLADSIFNAIEARYDSLKSLVDHSTSNPTVLSGILYGDTWFMPGGRNYAAKFFEDAGAKYLWSDNNEHGFIRLAFENVYEKAHGADYWIGVGSYDSYDVMKNSDNRYAMFDPFNNRRVYNYNARIGPGGGNDYFELGYLRPDLILSDLIYIFHRDKLPVYKPYFHQPLK